MQQLAKQLRPKVIAIRNKIPWVLGPVTYVYAAIAANGDTLREADIDAVLGANVSRSVRQPDCADVGILRRVPILTQQGRGPRGFALTFDKAFPLAKEVRALARVIGNTHSFPIRNHMPKEPPRPSPPREYDIDLIGGSKLNTLVLATVRFLRGKAPYSELAAAVPYDSLTAVQSSIRRLGQYGVLGAGGGGTYFKSALWLPELERLYNAYLQLRPGLRTEIRRRLKAKRQTSKARYAQNIFGYDVEARVLRLLAQHGPMKRVELASKAMVPRAELRLRPLAQAGILATQEHFGGGGRGKAHGTRKRLVVSLNAAFPAYKELRTLLLVLAGSPNTTVRDISAPRAAFDPNVLFNTPTLLKALLFMNAVADGELDVASLNRLAPEHAPFTLHGRMKWMLDEGIIAVRKSGHMLYYALEPGYKAYQPLKTLLDRITAVWPDLVEAARLNDELKPARRLVEDRKARSRRERRPQP